MLGIHNLQRDVGARIVELAGRSYSFLPFVQLRSVDDDLTFRIYFDVGPIHRARRRSFKVNRFAVITAAMTRALKLVLARFPVRRTPQVSAARINHEQTIRCLVYPNPIKLLPLGIDPQRVVARKTNLEGAGWFSDGTRQKETHEHQEARGQKSRDAGPDNAPSDLVDWRIGNGLDYHRWSSPSGLCRRLRRRRRGNS